jgi:4-hydroxythreonine-4-phosphate dehydrogenase
MSNNETYDRFESNLRLPAPSIKVAITQGDTNGIGFEVILKALEDPQILELFIPVIYGTPKALAIHRKTLNLPELNINTIKKAEQAQKNKINLVSVSEQDVKVEFGKQDAAAGEMALLALNQAVSDIKSGSVDVVVTAPINKKSIQGEGFNFPGHTEYLAGRFNARDSLMLMVSDNLRVGVATGHIPLEKVPGVITEKLLTDKIRMMHDSLIQDFGIPSPKIAILGLNPHSGENGLLGSEEEKTIKPVIAKLASKNMLVFGPFAADGFFGSGSYTHFDGILAMYHDQGLLPFKTLASGKGVNFTAGLPLVRTSPAHGTAFEIAGTNAANGDSMRQALYLACDIYRNRQEWRELTQNPLKVAQPHHSEYE